jgi:hypothetical protein
MVPYDVQIYAGIQIARGYIAEMKTGEGKTLTASERSLKGTFTVVVGFRMWFYHQEPCDVSTLSRERVVLGICAL